MTTTDWVGEPSCASSKPWTEAADKPKRRERCSDPGQQTFLQSAPACMEATESWRQDSSEWQDWE